MKTIYLEDHGQTILEIDINSHGRVITSRPDNRLWVKWMVTNHETIDSGDTVELQRFASKTTLIYPCLMVRNHGR